MTSSRDLATQLLLPLIFFVSRLLEIFVLWSLIFCMSLYLLLNWDSVRNEHYEPSTSRSPVLKRKSLLYALSWVLGFWSYHYFELKGKFSFSLCFNSCAHGSVTILKVNLSDLGMKNATTWRCLMADSLRGDNSLYIEIYGKNRTLTCSSKHAE